MHGPEMSLFHIDIEISFTIFPNSRDDMFEKFELGQRTEQHHAAVLRYILASLILSFISKFTNLSISIKIG